MTVFNSGIVPYSDNPVNSLIIQWKIENPITPLEPGPGVYREGVVKFTKNIATLCPVYTDP
jgi:hypothetical protein